MENKKNTSWIKRIFENRTKEKKRSHFLSWTMIFMLMGMGMMILASFFDITDQVVPYASPPEKPIQETTGIIEKDSSPKTMQQYEKIYENQLTDVLTSIIGVEKVTVKVNLDSTEELIVETNTSLMEQLTREKDKQGGTREISDVKKDEQVVVYRSDNSEQPLVLKTLKPKVRGVVIVAEGAEKAQIRAMISEAVQRLLDIPPHKIAILPSKS